MLLVLSERSFIPQDDKEVWLAFVSRGKGGSIRVHVQHWPPRKEARLNVANLQQAAVKTSERKKRRTKPEPKRKETKS